MLINPLNSASSVAQQIPANRVGNNDGDKDDKVRNAAVAPQNVIKDGDKDDTSVRKAVPVQPQESKSSVKQSVDKFA